jgi:imidazolonepropionase-like amidohydrolase
MLIGQTWLCPTLAIAEFILRHGEARGVPTESMRKARAMAERRRESVQKAYRAGVRLFMGTDSCNTMAFGRHAWELELLCDLVGLSAGEAIVAATSSAAAALDVDDLTGTIAPGKRADLLLVRGDPLADIRVLQDAQRLVAVFRDGQLMVNRMAGARAAGW